jgi:hypothetical protein
MPVPGRFQLLSQPEKCRRGRHTRDERCRAVTWLRLSEATTLIHHDLQKARERLQRAISKAWLIPLDVLPQQTSDPNVPLRIQVTLPSGLRIDGRGWLENPVLDWETTEIECLCKPWAPMGRVPTVPATQIKAQIQVWEEDLIRLWGADKSAEETERQR